MVRITEEDGNKTELKGTLQIGTMIPVPDSELINYDVNSEPDIKYKDLVWGEIQFIRKNEKLIIKNANTLYKKKTEGCEDKIVANCLDFKAVEKKCDEWKNNPKFLFKERNI